MIKVSEYNVNIGPYQNPNKLNACIDVPPTATGRQVLSVFTRYQYLAVTEAYHTVLDRSLAQSREPAD